MLSLVESFSKRIKRLLKRVLWLMFPGRAQKNCLSLTFSSMGIFLLSQNRQGRLNGWHWQLSSTFLLDLNQIKEVLLSVLSALRPSFNTCEYPPSPPCPTFVWVCRLFCYEVLTAITGLTVGNRTHFLCDRSTTNMRASTDKHGSWQTDEAKKPCRSKHRSSEFKPLYTAHICCQDKWTNTAPCTVSLLSSKYLHVYITQTASTHYHVHSGYA